MMGITISATIGVTMAVAITVALIGQDILAVTTEPRKTLFT